MVPFDFLLLLHLQQQNASLISIYQYSFYFPMRLCQRRPLPFQ